MMDRVRINSCLGKAIQLLAISLMSMLLFGCGDNKKVEEDTEKNNQALESNDMKPSDNDDMIAGSNYEYEWNSIILNFEVPDEWNDCNIDDTDYEDYKSVDITFNECMVATIYIGTVEFYESEKTTWDLYETHIIEQTDQGIVFVTFTDEAMRTDPKPTEFPFSDDIFEEYKEKFNYADEFISAISVNMPE